MRTFVILCKADIERILKGQIPGCETPTVPGPFKTKLNAELALKAYPCPSEHVIVEAIQFRRLEV